jgi:hypothetical protein
VWKHTSVSCLVVGTLCLAVAQTVGSVDSVWSYITAVSAAKIIKQQIKWKADHEVWVGKDLEEGCCGLFEESRILF